MTRSRQPFLEGHVRRVDSFEQLVAAHFSEGVNALYWSRSLAGDFAEVVEQLDAAEGVTLLGEAQLRALPLSEAGTRACNEMLADQERLRLLGVDPLLNCIRGYPRDDADAPIATDVYSFHVDRAPVAVDTWLCTYYGAPSEGLYPEEAQRRCDIPATRAALLQEFGGKEGDGFRAFLSRESYDLHYAPKATAQPFSLGVGNLWRVAVAYPDSPVLPFIHRAPADVPGALPRLLLIA